MPSAMWAFAITFVSCCPSSSVSFQILTVKTCDRLLVFSKTPISSTNKTDHHDITDILLKVALTWLKHQINLNIFTINVEWWYSISPSYKVTPYTMSKNGLLNL